MKAKTFWKFLILGLLAAALSLVHAQSSLTVLHANEMYIAPQNNMIVMDKYTFAKYHYAASQCDTLKKEVAHYDSLMIAKDSTIEYIQQECRQLYIQQQKQITDYATAYTSLKSTTNQSIANTEKLQLDYKKLENKNKRIKRWRNFFMGTALISTTVLILLVVH